MNSSSKKSVDFFNHIDKDKDCCAISTKATPNATDCQLVISGPQCSYISKLLKNFNTFRNWEEFSDIKILVDGQIFPAHRIILSASSTYFHAMFTTKYMEHSKDIVELHSVSAHTFKHIIEFIYSGRTKITVSNVQEVIVASDMLQVTDLVTICIMFLKRQIDNSNALGILRFSDIHNFKDLLEFSMAYIENNFGLIYPDDEFVELPVSLILRLLSSEYLTINSEIDVFDCAVRWLLHNLPQRRPYVFDVLNKVRLSLLSVSRIETAINECPDQSIKIALRSLWKDFYLKRGHLTALDTNPRLHAKKYIFVIGGSKREAVNSWSRSAEHTYSSVERYDTDKRKVVPLYGGRNVAVDDITKKTAVKTVTRDGNLDVLRERKRQLWFKVSPMKIGRILPGVATSNGRIYVAGGEVESQILDSGECYNPAEDNWVSISNMLIPRCEFGLAAVSGYLYAVGGWIGDDIGDTIDRYDPLLNEWRRWGQLPEARFSMGVVAYEGLIYVVGGCTHNHRHRNDLMCYNPVTMQWDTLAPMTDARNQMGVAILHDHLYVVGGSTKREVLRMAEKYSFATNTWSKVAPMNVGRASPAVAIYDNHLYVIGGAQTHEINFYRAQITISAVERYSPKTDMWEVCPSLSDSRSEAGAVVA